MSRRFLPQHEREQDAHLPGDSRLAVGHTLDVEQDRIRLAAFTRGLNVLPPPMSFPPTDRDLAYSLCDALRVA